MTNGATTTTRTLPPLENGDHLTRREFERRYHAMPNVKKAELIEGVVYMPSPVRFNAHSEPHFMIIGWLFFYRASTPGLRAGDNATVRLDPDNEPQPDVLLRLDKGGRSEISADDYIEGAPELVIEVAGSSASYDLHEKLRAYRRNGVQEYIVWQVHEQLIQWFALEDEQYVQLQPDAAGVVRSRLFPGLWLHTAAMLSGDIPAFLSVLQQGLATPEHQAFVEGLAQ
ncbi:MAG TPA: Uma2 family endonuclease [Blastocatellia bacterium]|nr:Uma2 family endonuclease [Blastocatellia bacterium]